jgi:hypothetical protein
VRILSACLPLCQRISRGRQAEAKVCTIVCATQNLEAQGAEYSALKTGIANAYADNLKVQQGFKYFTNQPRNKHQTENFQNNRVSVKSCPVGPQLHPSFDASSTPGCCPQNHEILLNRGMKY